jgi:hypothetical protein
LDSKDHIFIGVRGDGDIVNIIARSLPLQRSGKPLLLNEIFLE